MGSALKSVHLHSYLKSFYHEARMQTHTWTRLLPQREVTISSSFILNPLVSHPANLTLDLHARGCPDWPCQHHDNIRSAFAKLMLLLNAVLLVLSPMPLFRS